MDYFPNSRVGNPENLPNFRLANSIFSHFPNFQNLRFGELCMTSPASSCKFFGMQAVVVFFSNRLPSFCDFISHVLRRRSHKQMTWIHARRIIATMTNAHSLWCFAFVNLVRKPMCLAASSGIKHSISVSIFSSNPIPTFSKFRFMFWDFSVFINLCPKAERFVFCELAKLRNFIYTVCRFIHIDGMFGFRVGTSPDSVCADSFIFNHLCGFVKC